MKQFILIFCCLFIFIYNSKADQYLSLDKEIAQKALALLENENEVIIFCPSCENGSKNSIKNSSFQYRSSFWGGSGIHLFGTGKNGIDWCDPVDLAYLHIKRGAKAVAVAEILELKSLIDSTKLFKSSFKWIDRNDNYYVNSQKNRNPEDRKFTLQSSTENIHAELEYQIDCDRIDTTEENEIYYYLQSVTPNTGKTYVGEYPDLIGYYEDEYGDVICDISRNDSMEHTQSIQIFFNENTNLKSELKYGLELHEVNKRVDLIRPSMDIYFSYKKQRTTDEFYFYKIQEDGLKDAFVLSEMTFQYSTCSYKYIFILENIGLYKGAKRNDEAPLIGSK